MMMMMMKQQPASKRWKIYSVAKICRVCGQYAPCLIVCFSGIFSSSPSEREKTLMREREQRKEINFISSVHCHWISLWFRGRIIAATKRCLSVIAISHIRSAVISFGSGFSFIIDSLSIQIRWKINIPKCIFLWCRTSNWKPTEKIVQHFPFSPIRRRFTYINYWNEEELRQPKRKILSFRNLIDINLIELFFRTKRNNKNKSNHESL